MRRMTGRFVGRGRQSSAQVKEIRMRRTIPLVRLACALALLTLLASAIGVRDDSPSQDPLVGTRIESRSSIASAEAAADVRHGRPHQHRGHRPRHRSRDRQARAATHGLAASDSNSAATITGSFTDTCWAFSAHSSKDISHVEIYYVDGRVVKDESTTTPDYTLDGGPGDEIDFAKVKSGTTTEIFTCSRTNGPPTALLEILTPHDADCFPFFQSGLICNQLALRIDYKSSSDFPTEPGSSGAEESGNLLWGCNRSDGDCSNLTFDFRGVDSSDPDNDIASWSIDFDDGTTASGTWSADPPTDVPHTFDPNSFPCGATLASHCVVTLTVTDAAGQSDTDTLTMAFVDTTPD
jgi:hypothetical protein